MLAKWLAGRPTLVTPFVSKGFLYKDQIEVVIDCNCLLYVFPTCNIVNFLINFTFLTAIYSSKAQYSLFVLKVPLNPNQSMYIILVECA